MAKATDKKPTAAEVRRAARLLAQRAGNKGGKARMAGMSAAERAELGRRGARARWGPPLDEIDEALGMDASPHAA